MLGKGSPESQAGKPPATILVVDDEPSLRDTIAYALRREGFVVETAAEGNRAVAIARERSPDLVILDVMLPGLDGFEVCRLIRRESPVPIVMLSAKGEELDRVLGLEIGADDYIGKPFHMRELIARVRAQLRRVQINERKQPVSQAPTGVIMLGDVVLDLDAHQVLVHGKPVALKPREFDLLAYLIKNRGRVVNRDQVLRDVWDYDVPTDTRTIDVHVRWIRQKLAESGAVTPEIETVRGVGYRLAATSDDKTVTRKP
jgi:two-component system OmpR family response regulator